MSDLIERLTKAVGPDRDLDRAIFEAIRLEDEMRRHQADSWFCSVDGSSYGFNAQHGVVWCGEIPRFTASLDAALILAPENSAVGLTDNPDDHLGRYRATVMPPLPAERGSDQTVYHATLPIALCVAALKSYVP